MIFGNFDCFGLITDITLTILSKILIDVFFWSTQIAHMCTQRFQLTRN